MEYMSMMTLAIISPFNFWDFLHYSYRSKKALPGGAKSGEDTQSESRSGERRASQENDCVSVNAWVKRDSPLVVVLSAGQSLGASRQVGDKQSHQIWSFHFRRSPIPGKIPKIIGIAFFWTNESIGTSRFHDNHKLRFFDPQKLAAG